VLASLIQRKSPGITADNEKLKAVMAVTAEEKKLQIVLRKSEKTSQINLHKRVQIGQLMQLPSVGNLRHLSVYVP